MLAGKRDRPSVPGGWGTKKRWWRSSGNNRVWKACVLLSQQLVSEGLHSEVKAARLRQRTKSRRHFVWSEEASSDLLPGCRSVEWGQRRLSGRGIDWRYLAAFLGWWGKKAGCMGAPAAARKSLVSCSRPRVAMVVVVGIGEKKLRFCGLGGQVERLIWDTGRILIYLKYLSWSASNHADARTL